MSPTRNSSPPSQNVSCKRWDGKSKPYLVPVILVSFSGKGLGKKEDGIVEVLQIKRREDGQALGAESKNASTNFKWGDQFWVDIYNKSASKLTSVINENLDVKKKSKKSKKEKKSSRKRKVSVDEDDESDFDGLIIIQSSSAKKTKEIKKEKVTKKKKATGRERSESGISSRLRKGSYVSSRKSSTV